VRALAAVLLITLGLSRLAPAAPQVEKGSVWIDTVKRGPMLRQVRGLGTLVPEEIRWIPATTEGRVERIVVQPGATVKPDTVILVLSNPELELQALDAESLWRAAEAQYVELKVRLESQRLDQKAAAARVQSEYQQAKLRADAGRRAREVGPHRRHHPQDLAGERGRAREPRLAREAAPGDRPGGRARPSWPSSAGW
jgi:multidrug efflux pump subunit AcrA (membrane-fusion protein)